MRVELERKFWHFLLSTIGLVFLYYLYLSFGQKTTLLVFFILMVVSLLLDFIRIEGNVTLPLYKTVIRDKEKSRLCGLTFGLIAIVIVLAIFDFYMAFTALAMAFYGDMVAALVGKKFGRTSIHNGKTLEGSLAGFVVNCIIGLIFFSFTWAAFVMAGIASIIELYTNHIDDNFSIAVLTCSVIYLLQLI